MYPMYPMRCFVAPSHHSPPTLLSPGIWERPNCRQNIRVKIYKAAATPDPGSGCDHRWVKIANVIKIIGVFSLLWQNHQSVEITVKVKITNIGDFNCLWKNHRSVKLPCNTRVTGFLNYAICAMPVSGSRKSNDYLNVYFIKRKIKT